MVPRLACGVGVGGGCGCVWRVCVCGGVCVWSVCVREVLTTTAETVRTGVIQRNIIGTH